MKHILLLGTGCPSDAEPSQERLARDLAIQAPFKVLGDNSQYHTLPSGLEDYHNPKDVRMFLTRSNLCLLTRICRSGDPISRNCRICGASLTRAGGSKVLLAPKLTRTERGFPKTWMGEHHSFQLKRVDSRSCLCT